MASSKILLTMLLHLFFAQSIDAASSKLPIFYFHGLSYDASSGVNINANMTAEGRTFNALTFCESVCSIQSLNTQVTLATKEIRSIIANDSKTYANGYIFLGHSQGGAIARAVIEEMDDHNVVAFISLAGAINGNFYGPQPEDAVPLQVFLQYFAPLLLPASVFNVSKYSATDLRGKFQYDFNELVASTPVLTNLSAVNLGRSPDRKSWLSWNTFLPVYNNVNVDSNGSKPCKSEQARRKRNFLRLKQAHLFGSPSDGVISPYQNSLLGQYSEVNTAEEIQTKFDKLTVMPMQDTVEYKTDSYGLKTLVNTKRLHLYNVTGIPHICWIKDTPPCTFSSTYSQYVYPLLR